MSAEWVKFGGKYYHREGRSEYMAPCGADIMWALGMTESAAIFLHAHPCLQCYPPQKEAVGARR